MKLKFTLKQITKAQRRSRGRAVLFFYLGARRSADERHIPAALPHGETQYPLYRRLGGSRGRSGRVQKISPPTEIRSPDRSTRS